MSEVDRDSRVREIAYELWEQGGRLHGKDGEYWLEALRRLGQSQRPGHTVTWIATTPTFIKYDSRHSSELQPDQKLFAGPGTVISGVPEHIVSAHRFITHLTIEGKPYEGSARCILLEHWRGK